MTLLGDKLAEKLAEKKANDINNFMWKGPKVNGIQEELRLVDASYDQLRQFYNHCQEMLYNKDGKNPGRITLINIVSEQIQKCRAELLIRWLRSEKSYSATSCLEDIKTLINNNKEELTQETIKVCPISKIMNGLPIEFERIPISMVMDACLDSLGIINTSHLTINFIIKLGLCFTQQEMQKDLYKKDPETGKTVNRLALVSQELGLDPSIMLRINYNTGLTFNEFKSIYNWKINKYSNDKYIKDKYSNLTSDLLRLLSNKILYRFINQCELQAKQWQDKVEEINKVADSKGWDVTRSGD